MPLYTFSLFLAPCNVVKQLENIMRHFLWDAFYGSTKFPLVSWKSMCQPTMYGGLGVQSLKSMNRALLAEWLWRFSTKKNALWRSVIATKYRVHALGWFNNASEKAYGVGVWRGALKELSCFKDRITFKVGRGIQSISGRIDDVGEWHLRRSIQGFFIWPWRRMEQLWNIQWWNEHLRNWNLQIRSLDD